MWLACCVSLSVFAYLAGAALVVFYCLFICLVCCVTFFCFRVFYGFVVLVSFACVNDACLCGCLRLVTFVVGLY